MAFRRSNLAFDIDGIVANFSDPFRGWAKQKYGVEFISTGNFHWDTNPPITPKMFKEIIAEFIRIDKPIPKLDGASVVDYVWEKTEDPLLFVTARDMSTAGATHRWIRRNFPQIDFMLSIVYGHSEKVRLVERYDCYLEDRRRTVIELAQIGKTVFMPIREDYNFPLPTSGIPRVFCPAEWKATKVEKNPNGQIILLENSAQITSGVFDNLIFS